jgi:hypothetical protein
VHLSLRHCTGSIIAGVLGGAAAAVILAVLAYIIARRINGMRKDRVSSLSTHQTTLSVLDNIPPASICIDSMGKSRIVGESSKYPTDILQIL